MFIEYENCPRCTSLGTTWSRIGTVGYKQRLLRLLCSGMFLLKKVFWVDSLTFCRFIG